MQAILIQCSNLKKAIILSLVILVTQSASAQTAGMQAQYSAMVSRMVTNENGPSIDAVIIPDSSDSKFILMVENPQKNKVQVRVFHSFYGEVFRKETREESYRNRFDLSNAEDGYYTVEITSGKEKIRKQVQINTYTNVSRKILIN